MRIGMAHRLVCLFGGGVKGQRGFGLIRLDKRHFGIGAINRRGRSHQQMLHLQLAGKVQHVKAADKIGVQIGARVFQRIAHPRLGREVDDHIRLGRAHGGFQRGLIFQKRLGHREIRALHQHGMAALFQRDVIVIGHAIIAHNTKAFGQQKFRQVIADKARRARNKYRFHKEPLNFGYVRAVFSKLQLRPSCRQRRHAPRLRRHSGGGKAVLCADGGANRWRFGCCQRC